MLTITRIIFKCLHPFKLLQLVRLCYCSPVCGIRYVFVHYCWNCNSLIMMKQVLTGESDTFILRIGSCSFEVLADQTVSGSYKPTVDHIQQCNFLILGHSSKPHRKITMMLALKKADTFLTSSRNYWLQWKKFYKTQCIVSYIIS